MRLYNHLFLQLEKIEILPQLPTHDNSLYILPQLPTHDNSLYNYK